MSKTKLVVENCVFQQLTTGLSAASSGGSLVQNSSFNANGSGMIATAGKNGVRKSTFSYNTTRGIPATTTGIIMLQDAQVSNNTVGVNVSGFGGCRSTNPVQPPTTAIFIELGAVTNNATGFLMENPGAACANSGVSHGQNIWIRNDGGTASAVTPNIVGNTVAISVPSSPPPVTLSFVTIPKRIFDFRPLTLFLPSAARLRAGGRWQLFRSANAVSINRCQEDNR